MALPVSGSNKHSEELLFLRCEGFTVTLKGPKVHPKVGALQLHEDVQSSVEIAGSAFTSAITPDGEFAERVISLKGPLFFEETSYQLVVESDSADKPIKFWHREPALRNAYGRVGRSGRIWSAILNFGSQVGYSELVFSRSGLRNLAVTIEVFPTKLDYRNDWRVLIERISERLYNLAYSFQRPTFHKGRAISTAAKTLSEWYQLLEPRFRELIDAVDFIARNPHSRIERYQRVRPLSQVRRPDRNVRRWLMRHPDVLQRCAFGSPGEVVTSAGPALPRRLPESKAKLSFDTPENRFLKYLMQSIAQKLNALENQYQAVCRKNSEMQLDEDFLGKLREQRRAVNQRLRYDFIAEAGVFRSTGALSLVMQFAPGYRTALEAGLKLQMGISLSEAIEKVELKNLYELYEIWCFIELEEILAEESIAKDQSRQAFENKGLFWGLVRDRKGGARYKTSLGDELLLQYNHSESTPTGSQRPDNFLSIEKLGGELAFKFVLDAKYRISADNGKVGPLVEDINAMHRYRDAIVGASGSAYARKVTEAIVLFPGTNEKEYVGHQFERSIATVGVGGLPFLPGNSTLVRDKIRKWIAEAGPEIDARAVTNERHGRDGLVLVGPISSALKLENVESLGFYHVPKDRLALSRRSITHVALYEPKNNEHDGIIRKLIPVTGWDIVPRNQLNVDGRNGKSNELYYRIELNLGESEVLERPKLRMTGKGGIRSHRYIPLDVFDSTDSIEVMSSDPQVANMNLRIWRFIGLIRRCSNRDRNKWVLEFGGKQRVTLHVIEDGIFLSTGSRQEKVCDMDEEIALAGLSRRILFLLQPS